MELVNVTSMAAQIAPGLDVDGRERVVVVVKGTFALSRSAAPHLLPEQESPVLADVFEGEPGASATTHESDFVPFKPRCDVLLNGSAYAPGGRPVTKATVGLRVGALTKSFEVVGQRVWVSSGLGVMPSDPVPFISVPISYSTAYGGVDVNPDKPSDVRTYVDNPVGVGFYPVTPKGKLVGKPLPVTHEINAPITSTRGTYRPMAFGPIGRNFASRIPLAGTYDEKWKAEVFPFLPVDFDPLYYQSAPPDQQIPYPDGDERIVLANLTPDGRRELALPKIEVPVEFTRRSTERTTVRAVLDTLLLEPDQERLILTWRASLPLHRNALEIAMVMVGTQTRAWQRARQTTKTYYGSLAEVVAAKAAIEPEPPPHPGEDEDAELDDMAEDLDLDEGELEGGDAP